MKAVYLNQHGGPQVLEYGEFPNPQVGPGQVLVHLKAAALNRLDSWVRNGWPGIKLSYPHILGADGAGEVVEIGEGVYNRSIGEQVVINANLSCGECEFCLAGSDNRCRSWGLLGETRSGTYAEFVAIPAENAYSMPIEFSPQLAAAAGLVFHTAWHSLINRANLRAGETVLIVGASGGVNTACIQIAKLAGAVVIVVGGNREKINLAESLGADYLIDRSKEENWAKMVYQITHKRGVDVVVDNVGTTFPMSFRATVKGGRILTVGNSGGAQFEIDNRFIFSKHLSIIGSTMGTRQDFATVMELIFSGRLKPVVGHIFRLSDAQAAHKVLEAGEQLGKIVLSIDGAV